MSHINNSSTADIFFQMNWKSSGVSHTDAFAGHRVNFWRDMLPEPLHKSLMGKQSGDMVRLTLTGDELLGNVDVNDIHLIHRHQFDGSRIAQDLLRPRFGRFYPKGILRDMTGVYKDNADPFRFLNSSNGRLEISMGHPMAGKNIDLHVTVGSVRTKLAERGGTVRNWAEIITQGPGMQARWDDQPTDFFAENPFRRKDESPDTDFYAVPRLVQHIDDTAIDILRETYARFLHNDSIVLDLMSSLQSHLPYDVNLKHVTGLGLNQAELQKNDRLDAYVVHDLNKEPCLPFENCHFDVVLCSVSVEYLVSPFAVFTEVARVLKPGGFFVVSFSNRWFEPKVIRIWTELHEFERMGLVLEYFRKNQQFDDLQTYSVRGLSRPPTDKYYGRIYYSDPVNAVWGRRI